MDKVEIGFKSGNKIIVMREALDKIKAYFIKLDNQPVNHHIEIWNDALVVINEIEYIVVLPNESNPTPSEGGKK